MSVLEHRGEPAERLLSPPGDAHPSMALARVSRFDLLELKRYASMSVQVSRGCPFNCEFCDIIEMFGRVPRVKTPPQGALGARGGLFVVPGFSGVQPTSNSEASACTARS